jgi:hypothetical protein
VEESSDFGEEGACLVSEVFGSRGDLRRRGRQGIIECTRDKTIHKFGLYCVEYVHNLGGPGATQYCRSDL